MKNAIRGLAPLLLGATLALPALAGAAGQGARTWRAGDVELTLSAADFRASRGGQPLFSARQHVQRKLEAFEQDLREQVREADPDTEIRVDEAEAAFQVAPLSVVGTIVSVEETGGACTPFTAHDTTWKQVIAVDVAAPPDGPGELPLHRVSLLDLWPEQQVLAALRADRYLRKLLPPGATPPTTVAELLRALEDADRPDGGDDTCRYDVSITGDLLTSFSFHHLEKGKVAIRILLPYGSEVCRGQDKELGLLLPVPASLAEALGKAERLEAGVLSASLGKVGNPAYSVRAEGAQLLGSVPRKRRK